MEGLFSIKDRKYTGGCILFMLMKSWGYGMYLVHTPVKFVLQTTLFSVSINVSIQRQWAQIKVCALTLAVIAVGAYGAVYKTIKSMVFQEAVPDVGGTIW